MESENFFKTELWISLGKPNILASFRASIDKHLRTFPPFDYSKLEGCYGLLVGCFFGFSVMFCFFISILFPLMYRLSL